MPREINGSSVPPSRRRVVRAFGAGLIAGVAGCPSVSSLKPNSPVVDTDVTVYPPDSGLAESAPDLTDPPRVEFGPGVEQVAVVGGLVVGSSWCNEAVVETVEYSRDRDTLSVVVGSGPKRHEDDDCTGDESVDVYRAVVAFEGEYPGTVVATETGDGRDRSTTAHFEDSTPSRLE